ncbi:hypothetical protein PoB_006245600 [Plakobranchus ocellatus]|uniref:Uncharacterized protein n=1 Tax=Plakobranchus ocellatus TaxID=259542 RepID=A0AAV4CVL5_9GAST|nr:hypothetical protein PoB_006245600 [Plakobranchus ocellatus]
MVSVALLSGAGGCHAYLKVGAGAWSPTYCRAHWRNTRKKFAAVLTVTLSFFATGYCSGAWKSTPRNRHRPIPDIRTKHTVPFPLICTDDTQYWQTNYDKSHPTGGACASLLLKKFELCTHCRLSFALKATYNLGNQSSLEFCAAL